MTTYEYATYGRGIDSRPRIVPVPKGRIVINWITSTDHKTIGHLPTRNRSRSWKQTYRWFRRER